MPATPMRATTAQKDLIERLLKKEEIIDGSPGERMGYRFRPLLKRCKDTLPADPPTVSEWLDSLDKFHASTVIGALLRGKRP